MELGHLQHWSEGASSEELLLWMRSQHQGKALPPLAPVSILLFTYCTCSLLFTSCTSSLFALQGWSHLEEPAPSSSIKVEPPWPGALPTSELTVTRGTAGEGAPGHQPPVNEEVEAPAPTPAPAVSTFLTLLYRYLASAQFSAATLSTPTWPCEGL